MTTRQQRRKRRKNLFHFMRRTIVLRYLLVPFVKTSMYYGDYGMYDEMYAFGIRIILIQT